MKPRLLAPLLTAAAMSAILPSGAVAVHPATDKKPVSDEYHGVKVMDEYRWLEESGAPAVKA